MLYVYILLAIVFVISLVYLFRTRPCSCSREKEKEKQSIVVERLVVSEHPTTVSEKANNFVVSELTSEESNEDGVEERKEPDTETVEEGSEEEEEERTKIPRLIWTYWDSEVPPIVQECIDQWRKHCPEYTVTLLSPSNLTQYIKENILSLPMSNTPQRTSDFVRLHVLAEHGGVWADASLLLTTSLDWIHALKTDVVVYSIDHITTPTNTYPVLENWFIACAPKCDFIEKWKREFMSINEFASPELYIENVEQRGTNLSSIFCTPYLSMHVAAQYVLQNEAPTSTMTVLDAREGPYRHLRFNSKPLSFEQGLENLCHDEIQPVVKFRGIDREYITAHPEECQCIYERFFVK